MQRWYFWVPGNVYAYGPITAPSLAQAKQCIREWLGVARLPRGTQVWKA